ncbi:8700_t:CDS:2 [Entrophospora sp. SA101]|nr:8700_t:CDS:2 [Entrophospora sp. SA101]
MISKIHQVPLLVQPALTCQNNIVKYIVTILLILVIWLVMKYVLLIMTTFQESESEELLDDSNGPDGIENFNQFDQMEEITSSLSTDYAYNHQYINRANHFNYVDNNEIVELFGAESDVNTIVSDTENFYDTGMESDNDTIMSDTEYEDFYNTDMESDNDTVMSDIEDFDDLNYGAEASDHTIITDCDDVKPDRPFRRRRHCSRNNKQASSLDQQQPVFLPISRIFDIFQRNRVKSPDDGVPCRYIINQNGVPFKLKLTDKDAEMARCAALENYERYRPRIGSPLSTERTIEFNAGNEVNVTSLRFLQSPGLNTNKKGAEPQTSIIKAVNNRNNRCKNKQKYKMVS